MHHIPASDLGPGKALGRHLIVEFYHCHARAFLDPETVQHAMEDAAHKAHATVVNSFFHRFDPQGISGVVVISESHFTLHAWPEHDYAAVDIFTCSNKVDFTRAVESLAQTFGAGEIEIKADMARGSFPLGQGEIGFPPEADNRYGISIQCLGCKRLGADVETLVPEFAAWSRDLPGLNAGKDSIRQDGLELIRDTAAPLFKLELVPEQAQVNLALNPAPETDLRVVAEACLEFFSGEHYKLQVKPEKGMR